MNQMNLPFLWLLECTLFIIVGSSLAYDATLEMLVPFTGPGITNYDNGTKFWDSDLAVPVVLEGGRIYLFEGDVDTTERIANCQGYGEVSDLLSKRGEDFRPKWNIETSSRLPVPFFPLLGASTVPAGAIFLNDYLYMFMMNVSDWDGGHPGKIHANGILVRGMIDSAYFTFEDKVVWQFETDGLFVNSAPVATDADEYVYILTSALYRASHVYLARAKKSDIECKTCFQYFVDVDHRGKPEWVPYRSRHLAKPVIGDSDEGIGELHCVYSVALKKYVLMYMRYNGLATPYLIVRFSSFPWGEWSEGYVVMDGSKEYPFYKKGWGNPYGGYLYHVDGTYVSSEQFEVQLIAGISLWTPYRVFAFNITLVSS